MDRYPTLQEILDLENSKKVRRDQLTLFSRPLATLRVFVSAVCSYLTICVRYFLSHPAFLYFLLPAVVIWGVLEHVPGPYTDFINGIEFVVQFVVWWVGLGILSSIGLGSGLQTGILFLLPHIIKVCLAAQTCSTLDFESNSNMWFRVSPNLFRCSPLMHDSTPVTLMGIWMKILPPCILQSSGAAIGEIPPYWMTRSARLASLAAKELSTQCRNANTFSTSNSGGDTGVSSSAGVDTPTSPSSVDDFPEELQDETEWAIVSYTKQWMVSFLKNYGFYGVLLMASFPNIAFDICGVCCGHYLMPFWSFFGATYVGKVVIRNTYQSILYVTLCSDRYLRLLITFLQFLLPDSWGLDDIVKDIVEDSKASFRTSQTNNNNNNNNNISSNENSKNSNNNSGDGEDSIVHAYADAVMFWWQLFMTLILVSFLLSCISQFAQYYQMTIDSEEISKLRARWQEHQEKMNATEKDRHKEGKTFASRQQVTNYSSSSGTSGSSTIINNSNNNNNSNVNNNIASDNSTGGFDSRNLNNSDVENQASNSNTVNSVSSKRPNVVSQWTSMLFRKKD